MNAFRTSAVWRNLWAAMALCAWLVCSNHCALGLMRAAESAPAKHGCCHDEPESPAPTAPAMEACCQAMVVILPDASLPDLDAASFMASFEVLWPAWVTPEPLVGTPSWSAGRGPPRVSSFAELVLQRSLLSHAPPVLA